MEQYSMAEEVGFPRRKYGDGKTEESGSERSPITVEDPSLDVARYLADMVAQLEAMAIAAHLDQVAYSLKVAKAEIDTSVRINAASESARVEVEACAGVKFVAAEMPEANEVIVRIMAVAETERKMISARTKAALKEREVKVGGDRENLKAWFAKGRLAGLETRRKAARQMAEDLKPIISELRAHGITSLCGIAASLNARGVPAARGGKWTAIQVQRLGLT
jgi:hypothetical protein